MELTREYLDGELTKLSALVDSIKVKQGSANQRLHDATLEALGTEITVDGDAAPKFGLDSVNGQVVINLGYLAQYVKDVSEWAENVRDETVRGILKAQGNEDNLSALREQYVKQTEVVKALLVILPTVGVDVSEVVLPQLRAGRSASPTKRTLGKRFAHFYRILPDGERRDQSDKQNSLSSMAWYYGEKITGIGSANQGKGCSAAELDSFLRKQGIDSPNGKSWTFVVDNVTYGMDVITAGDEEE